MLSSVFSPTPAERVYFNIGTGYRNTTYSVKRQVKEILI